MATGEHPHRQIAITAECGLEKGRGDFTITDFETSPPFWNGITVTRFWIRDEIRSGRIMNHDIDLAHTPADATGGAPIANVRVVNVRGAQRRFVLWLALGIGIFYHGVDRNLVHAETPNSNTGKAMQIQSVPFGQTPDGHDVALFTITNSRGNSIRLTNYGAVLMDVNIADAKGRVENVNLAFDTLAPYIDRHPHFGSTIGRFCNRIAAGQFTIDGKSYQVTKNLGKHHLHGGAVGFDHLMWKAESYNEGDVAGVRFTLVSPDAMEGFPGTLTAVADYSFSESDELVMVFSATTDAPTHVNLCNHSYWNLGGVGSGDILDTVLQIEADQVLDVDSDLIPTGKINDVAGTGLDFRSPIAIGTNIAQYEATKGFDHCFVIRGSAGQLRKAAIAEDTRTGRVMEVWTTQPAMQLYTGNHLAANEQSGGYGRHDAFCLETQHHPDAPNHPSFPSTLLRPGQTLVQKTVHRFSVR